jgi:hypothetical protein
LKYLKLAAATLLSSVAAISSASTFSFSGDIQFHNDVVRIPFTINADSTDVRVWTNSYLNGLNFDPITAVWKADGTRLGQNDDDAGIGAGQTRYDSGLVFSTLAAGNYIFTVATYNNTSRTLNLADGFIYDSQTPVSLSTWCQPSNHCGMGTHWSVQLSNVSDAAPASEVPEPGTIGLMLAGLGMAGFLNRRRSAK